MSNELLDTAVAELRAVGIEPEVTHGGKHIRMRWDHNGAPRFHTVPLTPSDWRSPLNNKADLRAILRKDGLLGDGEAAEILLPRLFLKKGEAFCSSLDLARHFGKEHRNILRAIDNIANETGAEFTALNFEPSEYVDSTGRKLRCFDLSRDAFSLLVMGFTGREAMQWKLRYIEAFNKMEVEIRGVLATVNMPAHVTQRIEKLEGDLNALIDLSLGGPIAEPGYTVVRAYRRRVRQVAA